MLDFLKRRIVKSEKGAMDKILVTLLLVVIAVGLVVGINTWIQGQKNTLQNTADSAITNATADVG